MYVKLNHEVKEYDLLSQNKTLLGKVSHTPNGNESEPHWNLWLYFGQKELTRLVFCGSYKNLGQIFQACEDIVDWENAH